MAGDRGIFHTKIKQDAKYSSFCRRGKLNTHTKARKVNFSFETRVLHILLETKKVIPTMQNDKRIQVVGAKP
jgi:hypothetical protein